MDIQNQITDARQQWFIQCSNLAGQRWDEMDEAYSFDAAYDDGMTPADAVQDCKDWLDQ